MKTIENIISNIHHCRQEKSLTLTGVMEVLISNSGKKYLALTVDNNMAQLYTDFLSSRIDVNYIHNQKVRDKNEYHITIINYEHYAKMSESDCSLFETTLKELIGKNFTLEVSGIGTAIDNSKNSQVWFAVCESQSLSEIRKNMSLPKHDFHLTLAFNHSDVFNQSKDNSSIVYTTKQLLRQDKKNKNLTSKMS